MQKKSYDLDIYATSESEINTLPGSSVAKLGAAQKINNSFEVNDLMGKTYDAKGIYFDQFIDDQDAIQKAVISLRICGEVLPGSTRNQPSIT